MERPEDLPLLVLLIAKTDDVRALARCRSGPKIQVAERSTCRCLRPVPDFNLIFSPLPTDGSCRGCGTPQQVGVQVMWDVPGKQRPTPSPVSHSDRY